MKETNIRRNKSDGERSPVLHDTRRCPPMPAPKGDNYMMKEKAIITRGVRTMDAFVTDSDPRIFFGSAD